MMLVLCILLSSIRLNFFGFVLCLMMCTCVTSEESEAQKEEFLLKSHKMIEAVPNVLRRVQSITSSGLPEDWECGAVAGACDDPIGYEAIRGLHRQLDDDANGSIDVTETDEFLRDELQYENGRHKERHKEFHGNDKYINVDELWQAWKMSEVHNWTVEQTVEWLITQVDLPQYEHNFRNNGVNGASLPLLAQNTHNFISHNLGIKDSIHKQKIALKAMDVVLFGPPKYHNYYKDLLLCVFLVIAMGGCWFAFVQHKHSQTHMQKMMKDMEALQKAEDSLIDMQRALSKARHEQEIVSIEKQDLERRLQNEITTSRKFMEHSLSESGEPLPDESRLVELERELVLLRNELREAEKKLEARHWVAPAALQRWLQLTHELELRSYNAKKAVAEQQLHAAKEGCEKLSKKRATFMGAFRIAHGSSIDDVDDRIVKAKSALCEVTSDLQERMHRWKQIEQLCAVPIVLNPGLAALESLLVPCKGAAAAGLGTLSKSSSDATLREESPPPYAGVAAQTTSVPSSTKPSDRPNLKGKRFLIHRDSGISLTAIPSSCNAPSTSKNGNIPPPNYTKTSPSFLRKEPFFPPLSRVVYPKECYRPTDGAPPFDPEEPPPPPEEEEAPETPTSVSSCPEPAEGCVAPPQHQLTAEHSNGRMGDFVRKISAGLLSSERRRKPGSLAVEALKKSASSSNLADGASSDSSSAGVTEDKTKKKKFFQTLRHRKPKM